MNGQASVLEIVPGQRRRDPVTRDKGLCHRRRPAFNRSVRNRYRRIVRVRNNRRVPAFPPRATVNRPLCTGIKRGGRTKHHAHSRQRLEAYVAADRCRVAPVPHPIPLDMIKRVIFHLAPLPRRNSRAHGPARAIGNIVSAGADQDRRRAPSRAVIEAIVRHQPVFRAVQDAVHLLRNVRRVERNAPQPEFVQHAVEPFANPLNQRTRAAGSRVLRAHDTRHLRRVHIQHQFLRRMLVRHREMGPFIRRNRGGSRYAEGAKSRAGLHRGINGEEVVRYPRLDIAPDNISVAAPPGRRVHPGFNGEVIEREARLDGQIEVVARAAIQQKRLHFPRIQRIVARRPQQLLFHIADSIVICVRDAWIGPVQLLVVVRQSVAVIVFIPIQHAITIRIRIQRMRVAQVFIQVVQSVAVGIALRIGARRAAEPHLLPPIRNAVGVLIEYTEYVGVASRSEPCPDAGNAVIPVQRIHEILGIIATIVEHVMRNQLAAGRVQRRRSADIRRRRDARAGRPGHRELEVAEEHRAVENGIAGVRDHQLQGMSARSQRPRSHQQRRQPVIFKEQTDGRRVGLRGMSRMPRIVVEQEEVVVHRQRLAVLVECNVVSVQKSGKRIVELRVDILGILIGSEEHVERQSLHGRVRGERQRQRNRVKRRRTDQRGHFAVSAKPQVGRLARRRIGAGRIFRISGGEDNSVIRPHAGQVREVLVCAGRDRHARE